MTSSAQISSELSSEISVSEVSVSEVSVSEIGEGVSRGSEGIPRGSSSTGVGAGAEPVPADELFWVVWCGAEIYVTEDRVRGAGSEGGVFNYVIFKVNN